MIRSAAGKVLWVGRAIVFMVGLAVVLFLTLAIVAEAADARRVPVLKKGVVNTVKSMTILVGSLTDPLLKLDNNGAGPALQLEAGADNAPLVVNADSGTATNLDADRLDGKEASAFYAAGSEVADSAHADNADTAGTATNTQNADNAAKLGGAAAGDYVRSNDPRLSNAQITLDVASNGSTAWLIGNPSDYVSGSNANPTLILQRGMTYRFNVTVNGHPFRIASSSGGPAFNVGVTNNDVMLGTLTFKVPMDAPPTLHYYCLAHPGMNGVINIG